MRRALRTFVSAHLSSTQCYSWGVPGYRDNQALDSMLCAYGGQSLRKGPPKRTQSEGVHIYLPQSTARGLLSLVRYPPMLNLFQDASALLSLACN